jgi:hypothetical protein
MRCLTPLSSPPAPYLPPRRHAASSESMVGEFIL